MFPLIVTSICFPRLYVITVHRINISFYKAGSPNLPAHFHFFAVLNTSRDYLDSGSLAGDIHHELLWN